MKTATIQIPKAEAKHFEKILKMNSYYPDTPKDGIISTFTTTFDNGYEVDIKICNGDSQGGPYIDPVLFDKDGIELCVIEVEDTLLGEYLFYYDDETYQVLVEAV
jgi:hypothetical protein